VGGEPVEVLQCESLKGMIGQLVLLSGEVQYSPEICDGLFTIGAFV
jgi:hypothetical protein